MIVTWLFALPFGMYVARFRDSMGTPCFSSLQIVGL